MSVKIFLRACEEGIEQTTKDINVQDRTHNNEKTLKKKNKSTNKDEARIYV